MRRRGVRRLPDGRIEIRIGSAERAALASLAEQLLPVLRGEGDVEAAGGSVRARLFPAAYSDPLDELEFRELVGEETRNTRAGALEAFAATLRGGTAGTRSWTTALSTEEADAWLSAVNDSRLTLGMLAGVETEDDWEAVYARADVTSALLAYLGWLQEQLLGVLMGGLPDPD